MGLVVSFEMAQLGLELGAESTKAACPAVAAANHRCVDQQLFPTERDIQGMGIFVGYRRRRLSVTEDLVVCRYPLQGARQGGAIGIEWRYLSKRKILGETRCGATITGTG